MTGRALRGAALAALAGCRPGGGGGGDSGGASADEGTVSGIVLDAEGAPVVGLVVTVSGEFCIPDETDAAGAFTVTGVGAGPRRLVTYGETADAGRVASLAFAFAAGGEVVFDEPIHDPFLVEAGELDGAAPLVTPGGLEWTVEPGAFDPPPFGDATLWEARLDPALAPPFVPDGVRLLDLFALEPAGGAFDPPAAVRFPPVEGAAPGDAVRFYVLDLDAGTLVEAAEGRVDEAGRPATSPADGGGISTLGWLAVAAEEER